MPQESHISRHSRETLGLESLQFENMLAARKIAEKMDVSAADLYALGLIDEVLRMILRQYDMQRAGLFNRAASFLDDSLGAGLVHYIQLTFVREFPTSSIFTGQLTPEEYLSPPAGKGGKVVSLEELFLLHLHNNNPAAESLEEIFDDEPLSGTEYKKLVTAMEDFLDEETREDVSTGGESLLDILTAPARISPNSLAGQLEFLVQRWGDLLGAEFVARLLRGLDFIKESVMRFGTGGFGGDAPVPEFHGEVASPEYERFSEDKDWMPRCILLAKNTYVWLEQLSRKYGRWIRFLNEIPDKELDNMAQRGFTGLWLIGLWERSHASQRIKERMGDHDAVASAYSLYSYDIAKDLGGWPALENLRWRAWERGVRLSADMVPNHMGIDSQWVIEHPDWFLSLPYSPYPGYQFQSEDLCDDERVGIYLEDHYYNHTDAAVVFKRYDQWSGDTRYIYHGNDGTSMPWNDTAQLDYSKAEVREAVIQTILHVARNFPIIRFDAAMTLAKKHIQRLWFPEPGAGGAIPSRSEHGMSLSEFEAKIPKEFWREVVDRVATEVPDTLLLAEAFWLMEGYFVRTLGMHRVYNSAFMHMLRDEDNAKYRQVIKNTIEFDPQILKRYVNFMNNPDEKTAVEQFGDGDKYFGVCTMLATLPGTPMFGHGQIEGYREKYGMEFRTPKWDEQINEGLVGGHEWKIFPLLHKRYLFAESDHFLLYDFYTGEGYVNEDVFAYSNRHYDERGLVIYHNKFAETSGWIKTSAAYVDKSSGDLRQRSIAEGLDLPFEGFVIFKDYITHLEYIRSCSELWEHGLFVKLGAYQHHAFLDWRVVDGDEWGMVNEALNGAGVESVLGKWDEMFGENARSARASAAGTGERSRTKKEKEKPKKTASQRSTIKKRKKGSNQIAE